MNAPQSQAGLSRICPNCQSVVFIPSQQAPLSPAENSDQPKINSLFTERDKLLLDLEPPKKSFEPPPVSPETAEQIRLEAIALKKEMRKEPIELPPQRKYPWPIDIFLYPISKPGLIMLGILIGIPLLIDIVIFIFPSPGPGLLLISMVAAVLAIIGSLVKGLLGLYLYWYLCECVRDSAAGGIRAPETIASTPDFFELFWQLLYIAACAALFWVPVYLYFGFTQKADAIFWLLAAYAVFFFPMGLLAVIMFNSTSGFNPLVWIGSILSTFFQYCGLLLLLGIFGGFVALIQQLLPQSEFFSFISRGVFVYMAIVAAHLLGRFYWRYKDKLNWDV
jgi:hypothetical protein